MKTGDKYRFHLAWGMETEEQLLAGEFLEKLGHSKSKFILRLVSSYLAEHSEAIEHSSVIKLVMESSPASEQLEKRFREIIQQELQGLALTRSTDAEAPSPENPVNKDIAEMAKNLSIFDQ